jgi:hypothetical protein
MAQAKINLRPGVNLELTPTANEGGYSDSQLIRFFAGKVQKYGGWSRVPGLPSLQGVCRGLFGWADLVGSARLALGTEQRLYVLSGGVLNDITPVVQTNNITPGFTTTGTALVTIADTGYTPAVGDWVYLTTPVSIGGTVLAGYYRVAAVVGLNLGYQVSASQILPTGASGGALPTFTTQSGTGTVKVVLPNHGLSVGMNWTAGLSTTVGGVTIFGNYTVQSVQDANTFFITVAGVAGSTASAQMNGGQAQVQYLLPSGMAASTALSGWGVGDWGVGDWGLSTAAPGNTSALISATRTWSLDHFGQDLIASPDLGAIYHWAPPSVTPAVVLSGTAPTVNKVVFGVAQVQIIMACGSSVSGNYFPTLLRWCDSGDFTTWIAASTNQAGSFQIPSGSYITAGISVGLGALIWTDVDVWAATYVGLPYVFGFNQIAVNCPALSKKAPGVFGHSVIWPSTRGFFRYDGGNVVPVECPVWDWFFTNLDTTQPDQVCSAVNTLFSEVAWFFPCVDGVTRYVKWNFLENVWDKGTLARTAWTDRSPFGNPAATDNNGILFLHETSNDADGTPMQCYAQSGYYDLDDGEAIIYLNSIIPDFVASNPSNIQLTIYATDYPNGPVRTYGPYIIQPTTTKINVSLRGRQIAFRIGSSDIGSFWRVGAMRHNGRPGGSRP